LVPNKTAEKKHFRCNAFERSWFVGEHAGNCDSIRTGDRVLPVRASA
jgi:hypothetical protein